MILLELSIKVPPDARETVRKELHRRLGFARTQPGCLASRCLRDAECPSSFTLIEEWASRAQLDRHVRSEDFRILLSLMDMSEEPPVFRVHAVVGTAGLSAILGEGARPRGPASLDRHSG